MTALSAVMEEKMKQSIYRHTRFGTGAQVRLVFPVLMNTRDPELKEAVFIKGSQKKRE